MRLSMHALCAMRMGLQVSALAELGALVRVLCGFAVHLLCVCVGVWRVWRLGEVSRACRIAVGHSR